ncbi:helix-turn-helix domain-containing protein [bacterium]|nr:helix-turn-helix domain-containing protein [bacterium]
MSLFGDMRVEAKNDEIWKALADGTRRRILDVLAERPSTTGELVARFDHLCRTNVMKHIEILVKANLIVVRREGRTRWNYLNPLPIQSVCDRWVSRHVKRMASAISRLKEHVEERERNDPKKKLSKKSKEKR